MRSGVRHFLRLEPLLRTQSVHAPPKRSIYPPISLRVSPNNGHDSCDYIVDDRLSTINHRSNFENHWH